MLIKIEDKNLMVGMTWHVMVNNTSSVNKSVKQKKSSWYWHANNVFFFGSVPKSEKLTRKDLPVYSSVIAFSVTQPTGNSLAIVSVPDTEHYLICGVFQGRPKEGYDCTVSSLEEVSNIVSSFSDLCGNAGFTLLGDIKLSDMQFFSMQNLIESLTEYSKLKRVRSEIINPVTILIGLAAFGFAGSEGWKQYVKYRNNQIAIKLAQQQKSSQQLYDEALVDKRKEVALRVSDAPQLMKKMIIFPVSVGGWKTKSAKCTANQSKNVFCTLSFIKGSKGEITNKSFLSYSEPYKFLAIRYLPNLTTIEADLEITGLPFTTMADVLDSALPLKSEWLDFGSQVQRLIPFGSPTVTQYAPISLRNDAQNGQISTLPPLSAKWTQSGPIRILEMLKDFPKYAVLNSVNLSVSDTPKYEVKSSFLTVEIDSNVFAKQN